MPAAQQSIKAAAVAIREFGIWWLSIPMTRPYYTSNNPKGRATLDVLLMRATDSNGRVGWGEACPSLSGYSPETPQSGWAFLREFLPGMIGEFDGTRAKQVESRFHEYPFVLSGFKECIADLVHAPLLEPLAKPVELELAATVNTLDLDEAAQIALKYVDAGYSTLKVKVGMDPKMDAARVIRIYEAVRGRARQRVDANRGYQPDAALEFANSVPVDAVEFFEQPFKHTEWQETERLAKRSPLPLMLDESIYGIDDIARVASTGCAKAVKLKMSKVGGPSALIEHINFARGHGLEVVVGNGVASDFGCYREALCCAKGGLRNAGEMNGFLKLTQGILDTPLKMNGSRLVLGVGRRPAIVHSQVVALAKDFFVIPKCS